ncbi:MAG: serine/threonine-protein phosphatase, partial [Dehalococcoidia bacterium]|nr:serine/threonine-protein phosphatase [Dehalococcoidia bacterium]
MTTSQLLVSHHKDPGRVRDHQEDDCRNFAIHHDAGDFHLLVVADGMGGHSHGEVASRLAIETLAQFIQYGSWTDPMDALRQAFALANDRVHSQGEDMGTTLTAVLFAEATRQYWWANVGDSRAYLLDGATLSQLSHDHSEIQVRVDAGQLTQEEARLAKGRNVLLKAIGPSPRVEADVEGPFELQRGQRLMLCSDGLHGMLSEPELAAITQHDLQNVAKDLVAAANVAGGRDNIAAVVAALSSGEATQWMGPPPAVVGKPHSPFARFGKFVPAAAAAAVGVVFVTIVVVWALVSQDGGDVGGGADSGQGSATNTPSAAPGASTPTPSPAASQTATKTSTATPRIPEPTTATTAQGGGGTGKPPTPTPISPTETSTQTPTSTASPTPTKTPTPTPAPPQKPAIPDVSVAQEAGWITITWKVAPGGIESFTVH